MPRERKSRVGFSFPKRVVPMPNAMNSPKAPENGKPRPHPLPEHSRRRMFRSPAWFAALLVLIVVVVLVWIFVPY